MKKRQLQIWNMQLTAAQQKIDSLQEELDYFNGVRRGKRINC